MRSLVQAVVAVAVGLMVLAGCNLTGPRPPTPDVRATILESTYRTVCPHVSRPRRSSVAFNNEVDFDLLWRYFVRGWTFSKTRNTETFDYEDFLRDRPGEAIDLLVRGYRSAKSRQMPAFASMMYGFYQQENFEDYQETAYSQALYDILSKRTTFERTLGELRDHLTDHPDDYRMSKLIVVLLKKEQRWIYFFPQLQQSQMKN